MESQVKLYPDGQIAEFKDGNLIRKISTNGSIHELIKALKFSRSSSFILSCDETAPIDEPPQSRGGRHINEVGLKLLTTFEGCEEKFNDGGVDLLRSYDDSVGVWTIGYGHTGTAIVPGLTITQAEAEEFLRQDLEKFESYVEDLVQVELNVDQFSALVCFCYNTGPGEEGFGGSTLLRLLNGGDFEGAADQFTRWNKGGGKPMLGLTRRRLAERSLFRSEPWEAALTYEGPLDIVANVDRPSLSTASATGPRTLKLTDPVMQGEDVQVLQKALIQLGFAVNSDGFFGPKTDAAVRQLQAQKGLEVDGLAGMTTLQSISLA
jgi:lysozyme